MLLAIDTLARQSFVNSKRGIIISKSKCGSDDEESGNGHVNGHLQLQTPPWDFHNHLIVLCLAPKCTTVMCNGVL